jgi:hypothetical protein
MRNKRVRVRVAANMVTRVRYPYPDTGSAIALAIYLAAYVGLAGCFAAGLYWLMQPSVFPNAGLAAYKPPPNTVVTFSGSPGAWTPRPLLEQTPALAVVEPAPVVAESPVVTPKKEAKKQQAVAAPRARRPGPERRNPMQDYAYQPSYGQSSYGFRPWF